MYIYKITNTINDKIYIGLTSHDNLKIRWKSHMDALALYKFETDNNLKHKSKSKLYAAMIKYGVENFEISPIKHCDTYEELNYYEDYYIETLNTRDNAFGYNICRGGGGHKAEPYNKGKKNCQPKTEKMLEALEKGRHLPASEKQKKQLSERRKGITVTPETREKLRIKASDYKWMINPNSQNPQAEQIKTSLVDEYLNKGYIFGRKIK